MRSTHRNSAVRAWMLLPAFVAAVIACGSPPPSQEVLAMAPALPLEIAEHFSALAFGDVRPLEPSESQLVQVSVDAAIATVLANPPDIRGPNDDVVVWRTGGCVFLGWYQRRPMSRAPEPGPPTPVYMVQLFGDPVPGWPGPKEAVVMVNATTGERGTAISGDSLLGTTCGVVR